MKRLRVKTAFKKRQLQRTKERTFLMGVQCGAKVSSTLIKSGWTDMGKMEHEVVDRIRGR